jgi:hypothetical protein
MQLWKVEVLTSTKSNEYIFVQMKFIEGFVKGLKGLACLSMELCLY